MKNYPLWYYFGRKNSDKESRYCYKIEKKEKESKVEIPKEKQRDFIEQREKLKIGIEPKNEWLENPGECSFTSVEEGRTYRVRRSSPRRAEDISVGKLDNLRDYRARFSWHEGSEEVFSTVNIGGAYPFLPVEHIDKTLVQEVSTSIGDIDGNNISGFWSEIRKVIGNEYDGRTPIALDKSEIQTLIGLVDNMIGLLDKDTKKDEVPELKRRLRDLLEEMFDELSNSQRLPVVREFYTTPRETPEPGSTNFDKERFEAPIRDIFDSFYFKPISGEDTPDLLRSRAMRQLIALYAREDEAGRKAMLERIFDSLTEGAIAELNKVKGDLTHDEKKSFTISYDVLERLRGEEFLRLQHNAEKNEDGTWKIRHEESNKELNFRFVEGKRGSNGEWQMKYPSGGWKSLTEGFRPDEDYFKKVVKDLIIGLDGISKMRFAKKFGTDFLRENEVTLEYFGKLEEKPERERLREISRSGSEFFLKVDIPVVTPAEPEEMDEFEMVDVGLESEEIISYYSRFIDEVGTFLLVPADQQVLSDNTFKFSVMDADSETPEDIEVRKLSEVETQSLAYQALTTPQPYTEQPELHRSSLENILGLCTWDATLRNNYQREAVAILEPMYLRAFDKKAFLESLIKELNDDQNRNHLSKDSVERLRRKFIRLEQQEAFSPEIDPEKDSEIKIGTHSIEVIPVDDGLKFVLVGPEGGEKGMLLLRDQKEDSPYFYGIEDARNTKSGNICFLPKERIQGYVTLTLIVGGRQVLNDIPLKIKGAEEARERLILERRKRILERDLIEIGKVERDKRNAEKIGGESILSPEMWEEIGRDRLQSTLGIQAMVLDKGIVEVRYGSIVLPLRFEEGTWKYKTARVEWKNVTDTLFVSDLSEPNELAVRYFETNVLKLLRDIRKPNRAEELTSEVNDYLPELKFPKGEKFEFQTFASEKMYLYGMDKSGRMILSNRRGVLVAEESKLNLVLANTLKQETKILFRALAGKNIDREKMAENAKDIERRIKELDDMGHKISLNPESLNYHRGYYLVHNSSLDTIEIVFAPFDREAFRELQLEKAEDDEWGTLEYISSEKFSNEEGGELVPYSPQRNKEIEYFRKDTHGRTAFYRRTIDGVKTLLLSDDGERLVWQSTDEYPKLQERE